MTTVTSSYRDALKAQPYRGPHFAVRIQFQGYDFKAWSGVGPKPISGQTYNGGASASTLGAISPIADTSADGIRGLAAERIEITLSGLPLDANLIAELKDFQHQGAAVTILGVLLDAADAVVPDPVTLFSGQVDTMRWVLGDALAITLEAENFLTYMFRGPDGRRRSDGDQQEIFSGDKGFEFQSKLLPQIPWGVPVSAQQAIKDLGAGPVGAFGRGLGGVFGVPYA